MTEYIEREAVIQYLLKCADGYAYIETPTESAITDIKSIPAADVVERKTGKWIYPSDITGYGRCSECKALWYYSLITNKFFKVCPRCGSYNGGDNNGA